MYERAELEGKTVWGTGAPIDHDTVPQALYCYDIFGSGKQMDAENNYISQTPVAENCVGAIENLLGQTRQMACTQEMAGLCM